MIGDQLQNPWNCLFNADIRQMSLSSDQVKPGRLELTSWSMGTGPGGRDSKKENSGRIVALIFGKLEKKCQRTRVCFAIFTSPIREFNPVDH
jgi:hypothetical protein